MNHGCPISQRQGGKVRMAHEKFPLSKRRCMNRSKVKKIILIFLLAVALSQRIFISRQTVTIPVSKMVSVIGCCTTIMYQFKQCSQFRAMKTFPPFSPILQFRSSSMRFYLFPKLKLKGNHFRTGNHTKSFVSSFSNEVRTLTENDFWHSYNQWTGMLGPV